MLTLAVPTFNRASVLSKTLASLFNITSSLPSVEIVVCDNASTDQTRRVCEGFLGKGNFRYIRNDANLGADANYLKCVANSCSDYMWIMGDDDEIDASAVAKVLTHIERHRPSMIVVNGTTHGGRRRIDASQGVEIHDSFDVFFRKYGYHFSWITSTILKRSGLRQLDAAEIVRSRNFIHLGLELKNFLDGGKFLVDLEPLISQRSESVSEYVAHSDKLVDIFGASLCRIVDMFHPALSRLSSKDFLMQHYYRYGMFDTNFFLKARLDGSLTRKAFFANLKYLRRISRDWLTGMAIFILPRTVVEMASGQGSKA